VSIARPLCGKWTNTSHPPTASCLPQTGAGHAPWATDDITECDVSITEQNMQKNGDNTDVSIVSTRAQPIATAEDIADWLTDWQSLSADGIGLFLPIYTVRQKNSTFFIFSITLSNHVLFWQFLAHGYLNKFVTKQSQNYPTLLMNVITLPCETQHVSICS